LLTAAGHLSSTEPVSSEKLIALAVESVADAVVLAGPLSGMVLRAVADAVDQRPELAIVVVDPTAPAIEVLVAMASGVTGYLSTTTTEPPAVADAVRAVLAGEMVLPREVSLPLVKHLRAGCRGISVSQRDGHDVDLTSREWEVLVLLRQTYSTADMARRLMVSKATIRTHVAALVHKLGVADRSMLSPLPVAIGVEKNQHTALFPNEGQRS
jgi:DNA-binding NarL/FixJ family response regulator